MSHEWVSSRAVAWVIHDAPVPVDLAFTLAVIAARCDENGRGSYQATATIAAKAGKSPKQAQRDIVKLRELGLLLLGDQTLVDHLPAGQRPVVYDVPLHLRGPKPIKASRNPGGGKKAVGETSDMDATPPTQGTPPIHGTPPTEGRRTPPMDVPSPLPSMGAKQPLNNPFKNPSGPFANAQEPAASDAAPKTPRENTPATLNTGTPETREEALPAAKKIAEDWISHLKGRKIPVIDRSRKAKNGSTSRPFWALVDGLIVPALRAGADETSIKHAIRAAFDAHGNTVPTWVAFERHLHAAQGNRTMQPRGSYDKPRVRVHIDNVDQSERDLIAAAFGETPQRAGGAQ